MAERSGRRGLGTKPLLSVQEAPVLLDMDRSTAYRAIRRGAFPVPVHVIGGRQRIPRQAVERLVEGGARDPSPSTEQAVQEQLLDHCPSCGYPAVGTGQRNCSARRGSLRARTLGPGAARYGHRAGTSTLTSPHPTKVRARAPPWEEEDYQIIV